ncbi:MAG: hypothetical protein HYZ10_07195 [Ignavibacteriales bacterium]|nr:hypothetical protein [Ignavibacteriales bacterium]
MKVKTIKILLVLLLSIVCMELDAQTVIREKVKIKPSTKLLSKLSVTEGYSPIEIHASGPRSFTISVTGPGGGGSESNDGSGSPPTLISVGAVNGIYQISVESGCECNTNVGVWVTWINPWGEIDLVCSYELWFYGPRKSSVSFSFSGVHEDDSPPIEFNYSVDITEGILCGERASDVFASPNCDIDSLPNKNIQLSIASNGPDCVLFDKISNQIAGTTVTTTFDKVNDYGIKLNSPYTGTQTQVKLLAYSNGIEHADSMFVNPAETEYYLDADNYLVNLIHGMGATLKIKLYPGTDCSDTRLAADLLLNIEITAGDSLGHLKNFVTGQVGKLFTGLSFTNGELAFDFIADGSKPDGEDTVYVSVITNNPNIWQYDFIILINEGKIIVQFVPGIISPGGTADIVLKKKEADGSLTSFPLDQAFNMSLIKGKDYGTINYLYRGMWPDTTDNVEFSSEPFKFTSMANVSNTPVQSVLIVSTYLDSGERIYGGAVINIGEDTQADTFYVKASFDKEKFVAGDTLNVNFVKVDKDGNISSFPAGTLYEVRVDEGCTVGELVTSDGRGTYFKDVSMPIQFVVKDSLEIADSVISVKVGVPGDDSSVYLSYQSNSGVEQQNVKLSRKLKSVTNANSVCSTSDFIYSVNSNAVAKAGGDKTCNEADKCDEGIKAPAIAFNETHDAQDCQRDSTLFGRIEWERYEPNPDLGYTDVYHQRNYPKLISDYNVQICYNGKNWQYKYNEANTITIGYNLMWCKDKVYERHTVIFKTIEDLKQLSDSFQMKSAITDLNTFGYYPILGGPKLYYGVDSVYYYHEVYHKEDFKSIAKGLYYESDLYKRFADEVKSCQEVNSLYRFKVIATQFIEDKRSDFRANLRDALSKKFETAQLNKDDQMVNQNELETQGKAYWNHVYKFIKALETKIDELRKRGLK